MKEIQETGKLFIAVSGPPMDLGEHRTGWMREYNTPRTERADDIYR